MTVALTALLLLAFAAILYALYGQLTKKRSPPSALGPNTKDRPITCQLAEKKKISHDTYIYKFALPSPQQCLGLKVGEHIRVSETIPSKGSEELVERKYTPISPVDQLGSFELLIKIYRPCERFPLGGKLTSWLEEKFNAQQSDKSLQVSGPFGRLVYLGEGNTLIKVDNRQRVKKYKRIVMIGGGTGITPLYQIIYAVSRNLQDKTALSLLFANKTKEDILLEQELQRLQQVGKLQLHFTLDNPPSDWSGYSGFVTEEMVKSAFGQLDASTLCLSCGPPIMQQLAEKHYKALGANQEDIHSF